jgi:predicted nucleic acid-binding protein
LERQVANPQKSTTRDDAETISGQITQWQEAGGIFKVITPDWVEAMKWAQSIASRSAAKHAARSMDIVHVALAKQMEVREFWSFDKRQRGMAEDWDLSVNEVSL